MAESFSVFKLVFYYFIFGAHEMRQLTQLELVSNKVSGGEGKDGEIINAGIVLGGASLLALLGLELLFATQPKKK